MGLTAAWSPASFFPVSGWRDRSGGPLAKLESRSSWDLRWGPGDVGRDIDRGKVSGGLKLLRGCCCCTPETRASAALLVGRTTAIPLVVGTPRPAGMELEGMLVVISKLYMASTTGAG